MTIDEFRAGDRVELHPATDLWMRGARFGTVMKIGREKLTVHVDAIRREIRINPGNIARVVERHWPC